MCRTPERWRAAGVTLLSSFVTERTTRFACDRPLWDIQLDREPLLPPVPKGVAFYDFPAEHWLHLKTTNPIESTFATVRLRTKVTKGPGSKPPASPWRSGKSEHAAFAEARFEPAHEGPPRGPVA